MADRPEAGAVEPENDLDRIERKLDAVLAMCIVNRDLSAKIVAVVEVERKLVDRFDDRLSRAESLERSLGNAVMKLALVKLPANLVAGAVAGLVAGGAVAYFLLSSVAQAH
jgi:hypothetical protein